MESQTKSYNEETATYSKDQSFILEVKANCKEGSESTELNGKIQSDCSDRFIVHTLIALADENNNIKRAIIKAGMYLLSDKLKD